MFRVIMVSFFILSVLLVQPEQAFAEKDCSCPKVTCGPCQKKVNIGKVVKFCDWGDINVCRKVVCENVNFYFGCLSQHNKKMTPKKNVEDVGELDLAYESGEKKKKPVKKQKRSVASKKVHILRNEKIKLETPGRIEVGNESRVEIGEDYSDVVIGQVKSFKKGLKVFHRGQLKSVAKNQKLFVGDELINPEESKKDLALSFEKGSVKLEILPKSKLIVHDPHSIVGRFQPFLYLVHGGVDFQVDMPSASFDLLAGQILTRASQGKHRVNYEMGKSGLQVKVESFAGSAEVIKAQDLSGKKILVKAGNFISWMSETPKHLFSMDEKQALAGEGFITPVFQMSDKKRQGLGLIAKAEKPLFSDWSKDKKKSERDLASVGGASELCQAPAAGFQQCAWSCEGNSKGAKGCQAKKQSVHCVRRVCNAAGQWGVPTAFASSYRDLCPAQGVRVGDCSP